MVLGKRYPYAEDCTPCTCHSLQKSKWIRDENVTSRGRCCRALVKLPLRVPYWSAWDCVPPPLPIQLPANDYPGRQQMVARCLVPCHAQGRPELNSWLRPGPCLAIAGIYGVNQRVEDLTSVSTFQINKNK